MTKYMHRHDRASKFDAAGWALFFIWIGIAWLAEVSLAAGLLGVATITLGMLGMYGHGPGIRTGDKQALLDFYPELQRNSDFAKNNFAGDR